MNTSPFYSTLGPFLEDFIEQKHLLGFKYETEEHILRTLDRYWAERNNTCSVTEDNLSGWLRKRETESVASRSSRVSVLRQFSLYLNGIGEAAYIPMDPYVKNHPVFHVLTPKEIQELFYAIDTYVPRRRQSPDVMRMIQEYKILFRLILTTGLRKSEALGIRIEDLDLNGKIVAIHQAKMRRDRIVYFSSDMADLLRDCYLPFLRKEIGHEPIWLFPSVDPDKHMSVGCSERFRDFWNMTQSAAHCEKRPTIHSLRHTYVVMRMNFWMENGYDLRVMMPYLSRQLGHVSVDETFYYYHQVVDAHRIIQQKDTLASSVIPEVRVR
jgi:integrase